MFIFHGSKFNILCENLGGFWQAWKIENKSALLIRYHCPENLIGKYMQSQEFRGFSYIHWRHSSDSHPPYAVWISLATNGAAMTSTTVAENYSTTAYGISKWKRFRANFIDLDEIFGSQNSLPAAVLMVATLCAPGAQSVARRLFGSLTECIPTASIMHTSQTYHTYVQRSAQPQPGLYVLLVVMRWLRRHFTLFVCY